MATITQEQAAGYAKLLKEGKLPPEQAQAALGAVQTYNFEQNSFDNTPKSTGNARLEALRAGDKAGVEATFASVPGEKGRSFAGMSSRAAKVAPESPEGRKIAFAEAGGSLTNGLEFGKRARLALSLNDPQSQAEGLMHIMTDMGFPDADELPPGYPRVRYDEQLDENVFLHKNEKGKFVWSSIDEAGLTMGDVGDMLEMQEVFGGIGGFTGAIAGKTFAAEAAGETAGRAVGLGFEAFLQSQIFDQKVTAEQIRHGAGQAGFDAAAALAFSGLTQGATGLFKSSKSMSSKSFGSEGKLSPEDAAKMSERELLAENRNMKKGRLTLTEKQAAEDSFKDMAELNADFIERGLKPLKVTPGEVTENIQRLSTERSAILSASTKAKSADIERRALNTETLVEYNNQLHRTSTDYNPVETASIARNELTQQRLGQTNKLDTTGNVTRFEDDLSSLDSDGLDISELGLDPMVRYGIQGDPDAVLIVQTGLTSSDGQPMRTVLSAESKYRAADGGGIGQEMYKRGIKEATDNGEVFASDMMVSSDALQTWASLERQGYVFSVNGDKTITVADLIRNPEGVPGLAVTRDAVNGDKLMGVSSAERSGPVIQLEAMPAGQHEFGLSTLPEQYSREMADASIKEMEDGFSSMANAVNQVHKKIDDHLSWNSARQQGRYVVNNNLRGNRLGKMLSELELQSQRALSTGDAAPADRMLDDMFNAPEGKTDFNSPELDVYQAKTTRDRLRAVASRNNDPLAQRAADEIDSLLRNGKWRDRTDAAADAVDVRARWRNLDDMAEVAGEAADDASSFLSGNAVLKKGADGQYLASSVEAIDRMSKNGAGKFGDMAEAIRSAPGFGQEVRLGIWDLYKRKTGINSGKFSMEAHRTFMRDRSEIMKITFGAEDAARMNQNPTRFRQSMSKSEARVTELRADVKAATPLLSKTDEKLLKPANMYKSMANMSDGERARFLSRLDGVSGLKASILDAGRVEVKQKMGGFLENGNIGGMTRWLDREAASLTDLYGRRYVNDLRRLQKGLKVSTTQAPGKAPEQAGWLRITRTIFGPLSRPQRMITAGMWNKQRIVARNLLDVMSDPKALAAFKVIDGRNTPLTNAAIGTMTRLGIFEGTDAPDAEGPRLQWFKNMLVELESDLPDAPKPPTKRAAAPVDRGPGTPALPPKANRATSTVARESRLEGNIAKRRRLAVEGSDNDREDILGTN